MTELYEQIEASLTAVGSWYDTTKPFQTWFGLIFSQVTTADFDTLITAFQAANDWLNIAKTKRMAELYGYSSATIDNAVKHFLTNCPMFTSYKLPKTYGSFFSVGHGVVLNGYRWASELGWEVARWDASSGYNGLKSCFNNAQPSNVFIHCNPDTGGYTTIHGGRTYEANHLGKCFWIFYKDNAIAAAKADVAACWTWMNNYLWDGTRFNYSATWSGWVWDGPCETLQVFAKLFIDDPTSVPDFERLATHFENGFINSAWNSNHYKCGATNYHYTCHLNSGNCQRRTFGTMLSIAFTLQTIAYYYDELNYREKWSDMVNGTGVAHDKGWLAMLESVHGMYQSATKKFKIDSTDATYSDYGTSAACFNLFLLGISPSMSYPYGNLAINLDTMNLGSPSMFNPAHFIWDYANRKIRIPVFFGRLVFKFGSMECEGEFPSNGIYEVEFNNDYTDIVNITKLGNLPATSTYLESQFTAVTGAATNKIVPNATLNGFINYPNVERGFEWGETQGGPYPNSWTESGAFAAGVYDHTIGGLEAGHIYYVRAKTKQTGVSDWTYGNEKTITFSSGTLVGWTYRKRQTVNQTANAGTNYPMYFKIYKGEGDDDDEVVNGITARKIYCNNHCNNNFGDLRFTESNGETELDYWIEYKVNGVYALIWLEVSGDLTIDDVDIYIYYGNSEAETTSSGIDTFLFFDDFEGSGVDLTYWTKTGTVTTSTDHPFSGSKGIKINAGLNNIQLKAACITQLTNVRVCAYFYDQNTVNDERSLLSMYEDGEGVNAMGVYDPTGTPAFFKHECNGVFVQAGARSVGLHRMEVENTDNVYGFIDGVEQPNVDAAQDIDIIKIGSGWAACAETAYWDTFVYRKCVRPEPSYGETGDETLMITPPVIITPEPNVVSLTSGATATMGASVEICIPYFATQRGFQWGTTSGEYDENYLDDGFFSTGSYDHVITVEPLTTYYYRILVYFEGQWYYGSEVSFTVPVPHRLKTTQSDTYQWVYEYHWIHVAKEKICGDFHFIFGETGVVKSHISKLFTATKRIVGKLGTLFAETAEVKVSSDINIDFSETEALSADVETLFTESRDVSGCLAIPFSETSYVELIPFSRTSYLRVKGTSVFEETELLDRLRRL